MTPPPLRERPGRPPATSKAELERIALELFSKRGFVETTVEDIAAAAGVGRRTFFRYYASKNDVVWGDFDALLRGLEEWLAEAPPAAGLLSSISDAVRRFNELPAEAIPAHRQRMILILHVPALQAHSTLRYAEWRAVIARFAARRLGQPFDAFGPQLVGHVALATAVAAYEHWLGELGNDLSELLRDAFASVELNLGELDRPSA